MTRIPHMITGLAQTGIIFFILSLRKGTAPKQVIRLGLSGQAVESTGTLSGSSNSP
jgi:hypothetical protein